MLRLQVVQADHGDCLILEHGSPSDPKYILVDGGPETVYDRHLRDRLHSIRHDGGKLDLVILSHIDTDHVIGLLDFMADLRRDRTDDAANAINVDALWHNTFSQTIGKNMDIGPRLKSFLATSGKAGQTIAAAGIAVKGIEEGHQLNVAATALGISINPGSPHGLICTDDLPEATVFDGLRLRVVGPTEKSLESLRREWLDWLDTCEDALSKADPSLAAMADQSVPNLSSIMVLAEADGKRILLAGDGRGDHLLEGMRQADLLSSEGDLHVDVLKVPHHGSNRNVTRKFFETITADKYVISGNGKYGNPDLATLVWIVEAAKKQDRSVEIFVTNETSSTRKLVEEYDPSMYGYKLTKMKKGSHSATLEIAS